MNNEKLILRALKEVLKNTCPDGECFPEVWNDIDEALNPKEEPAINERTKDALSEEGKICKCGHGEKDHWNGYCEHGDIGNGLVCGCNKFVKRGK